MINQLTNIAIYSFYSKGYNEFKMYGGETNIKANNNYNYSFTLQPNKPMIKNNYNYFETNIQLEHLKL